MKKFAFVFSLILFLLPLATWANGSVVINEIAWMGTTVSTADEWIELYNKSATNIDLSSWTIKAEDGTPSITIASGKIIPANGYFLLERTNNTTVPNVAADQIYKGDLGNSGEILELRDNQNNLVDSATYSENGPGNKTTKQTMERTASGDWKNSVESGGTPQNSGIQQPETGSDSGTATSTEEQTGTITTTTEEAIATPTPVNRPPVAEAGADIVALINQEISFDSSDSFDKDRDEISYVWNFGDGTTNQDAKPVHSYQYPGQYIVSLIVSDGEFADIDLTTVNVYSSSVIISEFLPNPSTSSPDGEWIELYNTSNQIANLSSWQLDDIKEEGDPFVFPGNTLIAPHQFLVLPKAITKISLSDDKDSVRLIYPDGSLSNQVNYSNSNSGSSIAFDGQEYFWTTTPTPGTVNIIGNQKADNDNQVLLPTITEKVQETTDRQPPANLIAGLNFSTAKAKKEPADQLTNNQNGKPNQNEKSSGSLADSSKDKPLPQNISNQVVGLGLRSGRRDLILILSIVISSALFAAWGINIFRRKNA